MDYITDVRRALDGIKKAFPGQDLAALVKLPPFFGARKGENVQDWLRAIEAYIYTHPQTHGYVLLCSLAQGEVAKCVNSLIIRKTDRLHEPACWDECIMEIQTRFCGRAKFRSPIPTK